MPGTRLTIQGDRVPAPSMQTEVVQTPDGPVPFQRAGMASRAGIQPLGATQGVLTDPRAIQREAERAGRTAAVLIEQTTTLFDTLIEKVARLTELSQTMAVPAPGNVGKGTPIVTLAGGMGDALAAEALIREPPPGVAPFSGSPVDRGTPRLDGGGQQGVVGPQQFGQWMVDANPKMDPFHAGEATSPAAVRQHVAEVLERKLSETQWGPAAEFDEGAMRFRNADTGAFMSNQAGMAALRRTRFLEGAKTGLASIGEGSTMGQGLTTALGGAAKIAGPLAAAGLAFEGTMKVRDLMVSQRSQNREFQSVLGGSNAEGFGERLRERGFSLQHQWTMGGDDANKLYEGAMRAFGPRTGMRRDAEDIGVDLYRSTGMSVDEITALFNTVSDEGVTSLTRLATAIKGVSKAAREGGVNADDARKRFTGLFSSLAPSIGGDDAIAVASAQTDTMSSWGPRFGDFSLNGLGGATQMRRQAASVGMGFNEWLALDPRQQLETHSDLLRSGVRQILTPAGQRFLDQQLARANAQGDGTISASESRAIGEELLAGGSQYMPDAQAAAQAFAQITGSDTPTLEQLPEVLVNAYGGTDEVQQHDETQTMLGTHGRIGGGRAGVWSGARGETDQFREQLRRATRTDRNLRETVIGEGTTGHIKLGDAVNDDRLWSQFKDRAAALFDRTSSLGRSGRSEDTSLYLRSLLRGGTQSGIVESLLGQHDGTYDSDRRFRVETADGPREVTLGVAMQHYRDQLMSGEAVITAGADRGQTVAAAVGADESATGDIEVTSDRRRPRGEGESDSDVGDGGQEGGRISVAPTAELRRWLTFIDQSTGSEVPSSDQNPAQY